MQEDKNLTELPGNVPADAVVTEHVTEDPEAPTIAEVHDTDTPDPIQETEPRDEAAVTDDPDVRVEAQAPESAVSVTADAAQEIETRDDVVEGELNREQQQQLVKEAAVTEDPDAPVGLEAPVSAEAAGDYKEARVENTADEASEAVANNTTSEQ